MFGRRTQPATTSIDDADPSAAEPERDPAQLPKGRATPSRKDSQTQRKQAIKLPADPKAAKKVMRQRERESRMEARAGLMAGDERYLPPRDQGRAKAFVRDYIDGRRRLSEYFVFIAVGILLAGFLGPRVQGFISLVWLVIAAVVILEMGWTLTSLNRQLKAQWPEKEDRRGCTLYAGMRALQIRKLRIPPPRVKPGGAPVEPKIKK